MGGLPYLVRDLGAGVPVSGRWGGVRNSGAGVRVAGSPPRLCRPPGHQALGSAEGKCMTRQLAGPGGKPLASREGSR
jgi:hypothetical protein